MNKPDLRAKQLKVVKVGNSAGLILPREELDRLHLEIGDSLSLNRTPNGFNLEARSPDFEDQMAEARKIMKRYRNALNELAK